VAGCRREMLDHVIPLNEQHLRRLVRDYVSYFHEDRIPDSLPCDFLLGCCRHQLIAKFFRPSSQAFDVLLPVSFFEGLCSFIDVRLAPPQASGKSR
jgi:hypothetical protein